MKLRRIYALAVLLPALAFIRPGSIDTNLNKQTVSVTKPRKVLVVVTSYGELKNINEKTGLWMEEIAAPYYLLTEQGYELTIASPKGGKTPMEPMSLTDQFVTDAVKKFLDDPVAMKMLNNTVLLKDVKADDYDAVFYPGGHAPMWDLPQNKTSIRLIESFYNAGKPIALVCHGPVALQNAKDAKGEPILKGKKITAYSNSEETGSQSTNKVPYSLEDMLRSKGANFVKGDTNWQPFAVVDGLIITGENPASSSLVAEKMIGALKAR